MKKQLLSRWRNVKNGGTLNHLHLQIQLLLYTSVRNPVNNGSSRLNWIFVSSLDLSFRSRHGVFPSILLSPEISIY